MRNRLLVIGLASLVAITGGYIWRKRRKGG
ncbi:hypothetical protein ES703_07627 [subsurface metagenome]